uniref:Seminal fluid protein 33A3 n=1 Tax=Drosophila melanogaster TaxID=7227 RepID=B4ZJ97_DROME|nr:seminal fluid protein 33A3 [Drosophila melanogaster]
MRYLPFIAFFLFALRALSVGEEFCNCNLIYRPLCASNSKTYNNYCEFKCEVKRGSPITVVKWKQCNESAGKIKIDCQLPINLQLCKSIKSNRKDPIAIA